MDAISGKHAKGLYRTYEGLKLHHRQQGGFADGFGLYRTYEGLKRPGAGCQRRNSFDPPAPE